MRTSLTTDLLFILISTAIISPAFGDIGCSVPPVVVTGLKLSAKELFIGQKLQASFRVIDHAGVDSIKGLRAVRDGYRKIFYDLEAPKLQAGSVYDGTWGFEVTFPSSAFAGKYILSSVLVKRTGNSEYEEFRFSSEEHFALKRQGVPFGNPTFITNFKLSRDEILQGGVLFGSFRLQDVDGVSKLSKIIGIRDGAGYSAITGSAPSLVSGTIYDGVWAFNMSTEACLISGKYIIKGALVLKQLENSAYDYVALSENNHFKLMLQGVPFGNPTALRDFNAPRDLTRGDNLAISYRLIDGDGINVTEFVLSGDGAQVSHSLVLTSGTIHDGTWAATIPAAFINQLKAKNGQFSFETRVKKQLPGSGVDFVYPPFSKLRVIEDMCLHTDSDSPKRLDLTSLDPRLVFVLISIAIVVLCYPLLLPLPSFIKLPDSSHYIVRKLMYFQLFKLCISFLTWSLHKTSKDECIILMSAAVTIQLGQLIAQLRLFTFLELTTQVFFENKLFLIVTDAIQCVLIGVSEFNCGDGSMAAAVVFLSFFSNFFVVSKPKQQRYMDGAVNNNNGNIHSTNDVMEADVAVMLTH